MNDDEVILKAREIVNRIENELEYPGQIKVNVIRETRAVGMQNSNKKSVETRFLLVKLEIRSSDRRKCIESFVYRGHRWKSWKKNNKDYCTRNEKKHFHRLLHS